MYFTAMIGRNEGIENKKIDKRSKIKTANQKEKKQKIKQTDLSVAHLSLCISPTQRQNQI